MPASDGTSRFRLFERNVELELQPHQAAKHASHRLRFHARKLRGNRPPDEPPMTDAEFDAIEDAMDHWS